MKIDPDAIVADMLEKWKRGDKTAILDALENDHPGLTAMFIVAGCSEKMLSIGDCNEICNMLAERRRLALYSNVNPAD